MRAIAVMVVVLGGLSVVRGWSLGGKDATWPMIVGNVCYVALGAGMMIAGAWIGSLT